MCVLGASLVQLHLGKNWWHWTAFLDPCPDLRLQERAQEWFSGTKMRAQKWARFLSLR